MTIFVINFAEVFFKKAFNSVHFVQFLHHFFSFALIALRWRIFDYCLQNSRFFCDSPRTNLNKSRKGFRLREYRKLNGPSSHWIHHLFSISGMLLQQLYVPIRNVCIPELFIWSSQYTGECYIIPHSMLIYSIHLIRMQNWRNRASVQKRYRNDCSSIPAIRGANANGIAAKWIHFSRHCRIYPPCVTMSHRRIWSPVAVLYIYVAALSLSVPAFCNVRYFMPDFTRM